MNQQEFKEKYLSETELYKTWGNFVTDTIIRELEKKENIAEFLKIKPSPRVKDINSLIAKAFFRGKKYKDPYNDITDKVGTRFVVLLVEDIRKIQNIIEQCDLWQYSRDRDFEKERLENPTFFEYQSVHYIVKNKEEMLVDKVVIPKNTPCEVQIRTLLQHAYAELTHNTTYKPLNQIPPEVHRIIARSMALIEATDELFSKASEIMEKVSCEEKNFISELEKIYSKFHQPEFEEKLNIYIYTALKQLITPDELLNIKKYIDERPYLQDSIERQYSNNILYRQPIILLLYYLIENKQRVFLKEWPLPEKDLESLFTDLGYSMNYQ